MDDYYGLIAKAVKSLDLSTETTRRAIYDLARSAMLAKLRSLTPALSESDIRREQVALDEAISKAEAEASLLSPRRPESQPWPIRQDVDQRQLETSEATDLDVAALKLPPRKWAKLAALTVMTLLVLATAGLEGPGIIASLRGGSEGIAESAASDRNEPFGLSNPANPLTLQRAALYEEDQGDPAGKQYSGTVVWRTDSIVPGSGVVPQVAIRADIEIPERRISVRWSLRSNDDEAIRASHTIELMFKLPADFPSGGISPCFTASSTPAASIPGAALALSSG